MLRITIDIIPFGDYERKRTLSRIDIINVTNMSHISFEPFKFGDYSVIFTDEFQEKKFQIKRFNRKKGYLELVRKVLNKILKN